MQMTLEFGCLYFWEEQGHLGFLRSPDFQEAALNQTVNASAVACKSLAPLQPFCFYNA